MRLFSLVLVCAIAFPALFAAGGLDILVPSEPRHVKRIKPVEYQIVRVDPATQLLTLSAKGAVTTLRVRQGAEITINGLEGTFEELEPKMKVEVTLGEPGVAERLEANGVVTRKPAAKTQPPPPSPTPSQSQPAAPNSDASIPTSLADKLANTTWSWPFEKVKSSAAWFKLNADMTVRAGWHNKHRTWKVLNDTMIEMTVTSSDKSPPKILTFNKELTEATDQNNGKYQRLP
jgi:hypothetical protein